MVVPVLLLALLVVVPPVRAPALPRGAAVPLPPGLRLPRLPMVLPQVGRAVLLVKVPAVVVAVVPLDVVSLQPHLHRQAIPLR
mgnify:CR=1 FL=1